MKHRTDIDGLRAVAIIPILLFHAGISVLPGGFLGVDVFFVISGFLITSIIVREIDEGAYSLGNFYRRRAVRIFPALIVLLIVCFAVGMWIQLPSELEQLAWAGASAAGFVSNIYFWNTTDYFSGFAETSVLLHTWSLGVEEQFYLFYPILIMVVRRFFADRIMAVMLILIVLSILVSIAFFLIQPSAAFYLLPSRMWQLAIGGLIAIGGFPVANERSRTLFACLGLSMILCGIVLVGEDWMLPFPWGLLPSGGAALVIAYGQGTFVHRVLALGALRWIGTLSYSLYLWHWPLITFYRIQYGLVLSALDTLVLVTASIGVAALSYYLVEQPMLRRYRQGPNPQILAVAGLSLFATVGIAVIIAMNPSGWRPLSPEVIRVSSFVKYKGTPDHAGQYREGTCFSTSTSADYDFRTCTAVVRGRRNIALIGDSHAAMYWGPLQTRFSNSNLIQLTSSGCRILIKTEGPRRCQRVIEYTYGPMLDKGGIDTAILAGRWDRKDMPALVESITLLQSKGLKVAVIGPVYEFEGDFPLLLARSIEIGDVSNMERFRLKSKGSLDKLVRATTQATGATYYSVQDAECGQDGCAYFGQKGMPLHFDYGHLTVGGAEFLLRNFPEL